MILIRRAGALVLAALIGATASTLAVAQTKELKLAHFVVPQHPYSKFLQEWADLVAKKSGGTLKITIFPNSQMGPAPRMYDMARTGQADITWFVHGFTPGRFPLTDISNMPYLFGSGEIGSKTLNEPEIRAYLDKEHVGVHVLMLYTHQPGNVNTAAKPVHKPEDLKGLRIRFASPVVREFIAELGGTPVGLPSPEIVENMQKGTLDGAFIDYGGAGIAFRMGPVTKYTTELYAYVVSFGTVMNQRTWDALSPAHKKLIDETLAEMGGGAEAGRRFDSIDTPGKNAMIKAGTQIITLTPEANAQFRKAGAAVTEKVLADAEGKGLPARKVYSLMQAYAAKHEKDSKNFWK
jgi:TRAP-type C4-dicarboxylate transport system substrate-binding protein